MGTLQIYIFYDDFRFEFVKVQITTLYDLGTIWLKLKK